MWLYFFPKTVLTARDKIYVKETNKEKNIKQESEIQNQFFFLIVPKVIVWELQDWGGFTVLRYKYK